MPVPDKRHNPDDNAPGEDPFVVRLDPDAAPGEIRFRFGDAPPPGEARRRVPALTPEASVGIPPHLQRTVEAVLGFIYELDAEPPASKPRRGR